MNLSDQLFEAIERDDHGEAVRIMLTHDVEVTDQHILAANSPEMEFAISFLGGTINYRRERRAEQCQTLEFDGEPSAV